MRSNLLGIPPHFRMQIAFNQAIPVPEERSDAARRVVFVGLPKRITSLSINEIGYRIWVGAVPSAASARPPAPARWDLRRL